MQKKLNFQNLQKKQEGEQVIDQKSQQVYKYFSLYFNKQKRKFLRQKLHQYFGKNFPIDYRDDFDFRQQWKNNITFEGNKVPAIYSKTTLQVLLTILIIISFSIVIWMNTLIHFFQATPQAFAWTIEVYIASLIIQLVNSSIKLFKAKMEKQRIIDKAIKIIRILRVELAIVPYFIIKLTLGSEFGTGIMVIFQWCILVLLYREASKKYDQIRLMSFSLYYEYETKLLDMIIKIFIVAHFIAILLYSCTSYDPEQNWLSSLQLNRSDPITNYNYAFYFTVTTIMTVGYGDITPKNRLEVIVVSFTEIFGIIMFGFMINQIGYCITSLRKKREAIDRDLFVVEKLRRHYGMNEELTAKVRAYLVDAKPDPDQVLPQEEQGILLKLNEEIREDVTRHNMAAVVRSSIFFICRWTRSFQDAVSRSLVHTMANPNDVLYQPIGKERIYIIRSGKVHIFAERTGSKRELKTPLKTIESNINKDISDNCYGYTAVLSSKPTKIYAISKTFTSCYHVEKSTFVQLLDNNSLDFEYYHEIKTRIDSTKCCESFQVPSIQNSKHHYNPSVTYLIKKANSSGPQDHNKRFLFLRRTTKSHMQIHEAVQAKQLSSTSNQIESSHQLAENSNLVTLNNCHSNSLVKDELSAFPLEKDLKTNLHHYFESSKSFKNYFRKFNLQILLEKRDNSFFLPCNQKQLRSKLAIEICKQSSRKKININNFI